jgi:hypothetical protein
MRFSWVLAIIMRESGERAFFFLSNNAGLSSEAARALLASGSRNPGLNS